MGYKALRAFQGIVQHPPAEVFLTLKRLFERLLLTVRLHLSEQKKIVVAIKKTGVLT